MKIKTLRITTGLLTILALSGCDTTTSRPYTASTENVIKMQSKINNSEGIALSTFTQAENSGSLACRLLGPVDVSPGKTQAAYIEEAFRTELFLAKTYNVNSPTKISGKLNTFSFSSISPAKWTLNFTISSNHYEGYTVESNYPFKTSFSAWGACKNVAEAFAPAVQKLIREIVEHPDFEKL